MNLRRHFLQHSACAAVSAAFIPKYSMALSAEPTLPPIRAITRGPKFHWRGYYDKLLFDPTDRFVVANEVDFEHRTPEPDDSLRVGMIDLQSNDEWIELGSTKAWNWQQGCMAQWLPGESPRVIWNDREGDHYVSKILDVRDRSVRTIPSPVYCVSPDAQWGLAVDFRRLNECRPGYGYAGIRDPHANVLAPEETGITRINLETGKSTLILSYAQIAAMAYPEKIELKYDPRKSKHWFNHLLFSPDGQRFLFLHRWRITPTDDSRASLAKTGFSTRMLTANVDGTDLHVVDPYGKTSHFVWRDPDSIFAWAWHPTHRDRFYIYRDRTDQVEVIGRDVMTENGHNTYLSKTNHAWVLNDTYPNKSRLQNPYLYHVPTEKRFPLGHFLSPEIYSGEVRCDNHPSASRSGRQVVFDSPHGGNGRQVYLVDVSKIVDG
jgi:hypothetical protein